MPKNARLGPSWDHGLGCDSRTAWPHTCGQPCERRIQRACVRSAATVVTAALGRRRLRSTSGSGPPPWTAPTRAREYHVPRLWVDSLHDLVSPNCVVVTQCRAQSVHVRRSRRESEDRCHELMLVDAAIPCVLELPAEPVDATVEWGWDLHSEALSRTSTQQCDGNDSDVGHAVRMLSYFCGSVKLVFAKPHLPSVFQRLRSKAAVRWFAH